MGVDQLHNGHGPHQEEEDGTDFLHVVQQPMLKKRRKARMTRPAPLGHERVKLSGKVGRNVVRTKHENGPAEGASHQCRARFVNVNVVLKCDEQIAQHKDGKNQNVHGRECLNAR